MSQTNRAKWDLTRFWNTLNYFEIVPGINIVQRLLNKGDRPSVNLYQNSTMNRILVVGATGGVGKRLVRLLQANGYPVRVLVRDSQKAQELLPPGVEIIEGDITRPETLTPKLIENIAAVICCTGTRVQPVEGDTPNRDKYYQGVKFYLPQVVDSPEQVEYLGMKNLTKLVKQYLRPGEKVIFDFTHPTEAIKAAWGAVDDVVMGGISESSLRLVNQKAIFSGNVSTANNGGFASVRTRNFEPPLDLSGYEGIQLQVNGDGKRYKFIIRCEGKWDGLGYCYSFNTFSNRPSSISIPFNELIPVFRAKTVPDAGAFDASRVYSMQLMQTKFEYNGELNPRFSPGLFGLEIESIKAYGGQPKTPHFILISSAGVTRPGRPGLNLDEEPPAVRLNDQLGGILTWKWRGEEVVRQSGLNYTIIRPCALTEKPGDKGLVFDQGDNIKGQVSRDAIAALCLDILKNPQAGQKTFEVREEDTPFNPQDWGQALASLSLD
ncbi:NADH:ubiquinone oxidoreductase complex I intermediate-associated protein 30 [Rippkaea orientalis PCC 8801]|uniref:NADH:ubiquinone oxidoreductase complex I intermediate-associated protein 30 n=1 Tax=Rippkaea orientalis (strain PCC 8801 / RF-1) TaxID=41431 RepID=B7K3F9_RIPO1|nr:CIA30 family protein [Rippkaea orientalis]ACK65301.1 NADH:ubiquinone oxidoreductase complex I intermediate-associated protein 30 [Rippkaea orientalis PCC 8801]